MGRARASGGLLAVFALMMTGCAKDTAQIETVEAPEGMYRDLSCAEIVGEVERLTRIARKLAAHVDGAAADDDAQTAVGLLLFWPALFLLEGEETAFTQEYARLKGQMLALDAVSREKGCEGLPGLPEVQ
jgi:hypothetical protein